MWPSRSGAALDLALAATASVRRASLYVGVLTLLIAGPAIVLLLAIIRDQGGFEGALQMLFGGQTSFDPPESGAISMLRVTTLFAVVGVVAISLEGQILAATMIGGAATGRRSASATRSGSRAACSGRSSAAAFLVGIVEQIVGNLINNVAYGVTRSIDGASIAGILAAALVIMPFAFYQSGIILGGVGAIEALRRSTRIARARWRLALLVALAGAVVSFIEVFALGAGLDLVVRFASAAGLGLDGSLPTALVTGRTRAGVRRRDRLAARHDRGADRRATGVRVPADDGLLGRARPGRVVTDGSERPPRLVTRPMLALIVLGVIAGIAGLLSL